MLVKPYIAFDRIANKSDVNILKPARLRKSGKNRNGVYAPNPLLVKKVGYNINVLQQTACLVVNPITVGNFAFLFNCTPVGRTSDSMMVPT